MDRRPRDAARSLALLLAVAVLPGCCKARPPVGEPAAATSGDVDAARACERSGSGDLLGCGVLSDRIATTGARPSGEH